MAMVCQEAMVSHPSFPFTSSYILSTVPLSFDWKNVNIIDSSTAEHTRLFLSDFDEF